MAAALDAGADDMRDDGDSWEVVSAPEAFQPVLDAVKALGIEPAAAEIAMLPQNYVKLEGKPAQQMVKLMDSARGARGRQEGLVERRHRGEGDRGLVGVRIFGIDPGSERTGYGCVETDGSRHRARRSAARSRRPPRATFPDRLHAIHDGLTALHRAPSARLRRGREHLPRAQRAQRAEARARARRRAARRRRKPACRSSSTRPPRSSARSSATAAPRSTRCSRWSSCCSASTRRRRRTTPPTRWPSRSATCSRRHGRHRRARCEPNAERLRASAVEPQPSLRSWRDYRP